MNAKEYRDQIAGELAAASPAPGLEALVPPESREVTWRNALDVLSSPTSTSEARKEALQVLQAGAFLESEFASLRPEFIDALRRAATDPSEDVRRYALGILMARKDDFARRRLVEGLQGTAEALLPPAAALGLLARDDHSSIATVAADLLKNSVEPAVRMQAVRVLGRDPGATEELEKIVRNKDEFREVRRAGAVALESLNPDLFVRSATDILKDETDYPDIKSSVGGALERSGLLPKLP